MKHKKVTIGLLIALICFAPNEWGRVKEWFVALSGLRQFIIGTSVVLFLMTVLAWLLGPYAVKLFQHIII